MLLKIIAFIAAALPIVMFLRRIMGGGQRPTRFSEGVKEFKKQFDLAVWIFLGLVGCLFAFAIGKLIWTWWDKF
jgi:multisubunit Na+/H+ antiporter MnhB subunit